MRQQHEIQFAQRMQQLPPYLFGMINKMKTEKRLKGDDVIDLGMGNPVDPTPAPIVQKLCEVAQDPKSHRYPLAMGLRNLRKEIAKSYRQEYGITLNSESEVICTIGSKEGISHLSLAIVGPGDTVLVPAPAFPIHIYAVTIAGGNVIRITIAAQESFAQRIATMCESLYPSPKVLIINYPHNPTAELGTAIFSLTSWLWPKNINLLLCTILHTLKLPLTDTGPPVFWKYPQPVRWAWSSALFLNHLTWPVGDWVTVWAIKV
jgi:alanine-synthesizing transaminase